jgi:MFS family permease
VTLLRRIRISHLRWIIAALLFLAAVLNYIDRSVLGLLAPTIQQDLKIDDQHYASVLNFFLIGYTMAYLLSGRIVDTLGVRLSLALCIGWWSVANALTGLAWSARSLSVFRLMLGLGEAGGFTASFKAAAEWFPASERGIAIGIYSLGATAGAALAPCSCRSHRKSLRLAVGFCRLAGFCRNLADPMARAYRKPGDHPLLNEKEPRHLAVGRPAPEITEAKETELALWKQS